MADDKEKCGECGMERHSGPCGPKDDDDDVKSAFERMRARFGANAGEELKSGDWFAKILRWVLEEHAKTVNADYLRRKYPGAGPVNQAKVAVSLACKYAALVGGTSAAAFTALQLSVPATGGLSLAVAVPAFGGIVLGDLSLSTRVQLRTTYDLSVLHGAPLRVDDAEDCLLIFTTAMGVKLAEGAGDIAKTVGPKIVAYNVRALLRAGLRKGLIDIVKRIAGTQLARKLTEKALMRLLVPGISIPIGAGMSDVSYPLELRWQPSAGPGPTAR